MSRTDAKEAPKEWLTVDDIMKQWSCGRVKARLIMNEVGTISIGRTPFVRSSDLDAYLSEHDAIRLEWGKG